MPIKIVPTKKKISMPKARPESLKADKTESLNKKFSIGVAAANKKSSGGKLKAVPEGKKGLRKLPTPVRNKMGFMKKGGMLNKKGKK